ncbi:MAG: hypothetical protein QMD05_10040 [Candidatus Brocadiaceae bacterium]|nr:hypothetical protein [Candidatus Brocadiaceae bacterium]
MNNAIIGAILAVCLFAIQMPVAQGEEGPACLDAMGGLEFQKQQFKAQYTRAIPKDINDVLHNRIAMSDAIKFYNNTFRRLTPYLPTTQQALNRTYGQDATRSIAGLDPGHSGLLTSPVDLATLVTPMVITLRWGLNPSDLDSHLTGPGFHVYYAALGSANSFPFAWLDRDDVTSFGPETIRIEQFLGTTYRYSVHDFTNRASSTSNALSNSGANVTFNNALGEVRRFDVTAGQTGTLWTVFTLDGSTGSVNAVNTMTNHSNPSTVP